MKEDERFVRAIFHGFSWDEACHRLSFPQRETCTPELVAALQTHILQFSESDGGRFNVGGLDDRDPSE